MTKNKLLLLLALLMTAATGAWAQEETLLVTMTAGETVTYDPATATDVAEITMTGATQLGTWEDYYYGNHYSWLNSSWNDTDKGTLEVTAKPGYTITKVVFSGSDIVGSPGSREVTASPFAVYPWGWGSAFGSAVYTSDSYTEIIKNTASNDILGIDKIEVYGYAGTPAPTYAVTFADGIDEPTKWTASPNTGVTKGETVTVTYTGTKKVLGVKAEKKAAAPATVLSGALVDGATIKVNFKWRMENSGDYVQGVYSAASGTFTVSKGGYDWGDSMNDYRAVYKVEKSGDNIIIGAGFYDYSDEAMVWTFNTTNDTYTTTNGNNVNDHPDWYGLISVTLNGTDITSQLTKQ